MKKLKENTFESYWSNGGAEALKNRFHEICSELGVWTKEDKGCENFGLYLRIGHSYNDENDLRLRIVSPKYYLTDNGADMRAKPNSTEDFDTWVKEYIEKYSWLFKEKDGAAYKHLVKSENPEPWNTFVANEGRFRKTLSDAFKSTECKYIDIDEQYDIYGEVQFEVESVSGSDDELAISMTWEENSNPDGWTVFKFDSDLNYTAIMNGETVTGQGYEDAAKQYVLRIANKYAKGEFAKEYEPECYELRVYLRQDFYTKASKNIWQSIESILEGNCGTYTNYQPEDWVDDKAAVWTSVEVDDLKRVLSWLKKRRSAPRIEIWDENKNNVTSQFWTPKVEESVKILEDKNCVVVKILDSEDGEARSVIESYGGQLDYDIWSLSKENIQDVKDEIDDWKNRIAFYSSYDYQRGKFGKKLTEKKVILHFDLEDGEHKAIEFNSTQEAMEYMDSDDFPVGEWVGDYELEYVKETKPAEDDYEFQVLEPEDIEKLNDLVKEIKDGNEDGWVEWTEFVVDVARKYLGESLSRYGEGEYTPFEDLINECEPFVYYRTTVVDKLLNKRLALQKELEQSKESTSLKEKRIESGELNGVEDYLYVIRSAGLQYIEGEKTKKGATPVVIKLTNGEARLRIFEPGNYTLFTDFMGWEGLTAEEFADDLKDLLSFRG